MEGVTQKRGMPTNQISFYFALKPEFDSMCVGVCVCVYVQIIVRGDNFRSLINTEV